MPRKDVEERKAYQKAYHKKWYVENRKNQRRVQNQRKREIREWFYELKTTLKCSRCDEDHPACIDFHHKDEKNHLVSQLVIEGAGKETILKEIALCEVLCSNCHRKEHWTNRGQHK